MFMGKRHGTVLRGWVQRWVKPCLEIRETHVLCLPPRREDALGVTCLPFLAALDRKGDTAPTVQGGGDVEQLELCWLPEAPQGCEEAAGRG